jgi:hypothetical protein
MFDLYHERQGVKAYFKSDKSGLHLKNLRTRNLIGIKAFILLACITHNMVVHALSSFKQIVKKGFIGIRAFVEKLACAKGWFSRRGDDTIMLLFTKGKSNDKALHQLQSVRHMTHLHKTWGPVPRFPPCTLISAVLRL